MFHKWKPEVFICALDIPHHEKLISAMQEIPFKYIGIMALEAGPLCMSWAMALTVMHKVFIISEYGAEEARKVGVPAEHIQIGIDTHKWKIPTEEEKKKFREILGIDEDEFLVLTVADNQERKNPHRLLETYADFAKGKKTRYIFVTREFNPAGGRLTDYATELGFHQNMMWFERGMSHKQLWSLYAIADVFLLASKSEGLGMPLLEAMSVGVQIVATNCTAISELLSDNRGPFLVFRDRFVALRVSNFLLLTMLFLVGYRLARATQSNPWIVGSIMLLVGLVMVGIPIPLGG